MATGVRPSIVLHASLPRRRFSQAKKGEYHPHSNEKEDVQKRERLCALIHLLVHHRPLRDIRALVAEVEAELKKPPAPTAKTESVEEEAQRGGQQ